MHKSKTDCISYGEISYLTSNIERVAQNVEIYFSTYQKADGMTTYCRKLHLNTCIPVRS